MGGVIKDIIARSIGALFSKPRSIRPLQFVVCKYIRSLIDLWIHVAVPVYFMSLSLVVFSSLMYHVEKTDHMLCVMGDGTIIDHWVSSQFVHQSSSGR